MWQLFFEQRAKGSEHYIGVDCNIRGYIAVVAGPKYGKIWKLGKMCYYIQKKYENIKRDSIK